MGESFNPSSGEFVAPHTGNYYFSLSGVTGTNKGVTTLSVTLNGEVIYIQDGNHRTGLNSISYSFIVPMTAGDKMLLTVTSNNLFVNEENFLFLNGFSLVCYIDF